MMSSKSIAQALRTSMRHLSSKTNIDAKEIQHFGQHSTEWWDSMGVFRPLHSLNKLRVPLVRDGLINLNVVPHHIINSGTPLKGLSILDVGCGGGIFSEALARIGADITGLDASPDMIEIANSHMKTESLVKVQYLCTSIEEHAKSNSEKYDAVVSSEVIEHVNQKEDFIKGCVQCLKPGGSFFLTTINKNWLSNFAVIWLGESLSLLPKGTHEYDKFVEPHVLQRIIEKENVKVVLLHGILYNPFTNEWSWTMNHNISYAVHSVKLNS